MQGDHGHGEWGVRREGGGGKQLTDGNSTQLFQLTVTVRNSAVGGRVELYYHVRGKNNKAGKKK